MKKLKTAMLSLLILTAQSAHAHSSVLYIGDSHTAGTFGKTLDSLLREEHSSVVTVGSCGSSPQWWFDGHPTSCGYFFHADGPAPRRNPLRHATPTLESLVDTYRPNVIVIALGANLINQSPAKIYRDARRLAVAARGNSERCIWVGPPHGGNKPSYLLDPLYEGLRRATNGFCDFVDSRPYAPWPEGRGGRHFEELGPTGRTIARNWAMRVFEDIRRILRN